MLEKRRRVWRQADREHDEGSFLHSYALQDQYSASEDSPTKDTSSQGNEGDFQNYYDFYLKYYQRKYGVEEKKTTPATDTISGKETKDVKAKTKSDTMIPEVTKEVKAKPVNALSSLATYTDSEDDEDQ